MNKLNANRIITAAGVPPIFVQNGYEPTNSSASLDTLTRNGFDVFLSLVTAAALIYLIYSGLQYITAGGDTEKATKARRGLIYAIIGIILVTGAYFIISASVQQSQSMLGS